jgi:hypothetical protein
MIFIGFVAHMGEKNNAYKELVVRSEENGPLGRTRCRYNETVKIYLKYDEARQTVFIQLGIDRKL